MPNYRSNQEEHTQSADNAAHAEHARIESLQRLTTQLASGQIPASEGVARLALASDGKKADSRNETSLRSLLREWMCLLEEAEQNGSLAPESEEEAQEAAQRHRIWVEECGRQEAREEELLSFFCAEMKDEYGEEALWDMEEEPPEWKVALERYKATGSTGLVGPVESQGLSQTADLKRAVQQGVVDLVLGRRGVAEVIAWQKLLARLIPPPAEDEERPLAERFAAVKKKLLIALDEEQARLAPQIARQGEGMAAIEQHRRRVEQEDPDRRQLSCWRQELIEELTRTGILGESQRVERDGS